MKQRNKSNKQTNIHNQNQGTISLKKKKKALIEETRFSLLYFIYQFYTTTDIVKSISTP